MAKPLYIRLTRNGDYQWFADGDVLGRGSLQQLQAERELLSGARLWFLLPGDKVALNQLPCSTKERRHLRKAAPYELEEQLISDVEQLHFAFTSPQDDQVTAACCDQDWLQQQLDAFQEAGLEVNHMVPEPLMLPQVENGWSLGVSGRSVVVRCGASQGFALESPLMPTALQQLSEQHEPESVLLLAANDQQLGQLQRLLPESLRERCQSRLETWPQTVLAAAEQSPVLDMRQGKFSNHLPVARWWQQWQRVAIFAAAVLLVFVVAQVVQYNQAKTQGQKIEQQIAQTVSESLSRRISGRTAERLLNSLRSELRKRRGNNGGGYQSPTAILAEIMPVFAATQGVVPGNITFTGRSGEVRINCWAPNFDALQKIQMALEKQRYQVRFTSSADGDGQQGNFRIQRADRANAVAGR
ncbi:type II secretion system protein GspL [Porticoccus sp. W117]|uniref:type II secretion system protein GspL n=1 Tax=Porticoccus sp. W117 TaxID=3054777 RepID=UPI0025969D93|nr:type II secretion system protein GspL [Porticoccus sp. W117]MDM3869756.1 type II secretion system protein GspL [Porticoccus sp. W117]